MSVRHQYTSICTVCRAPLGPGDSACSNPARVDCPACQSIARGDRLPTAPAQPDPNSGWIPLTPGCAMPEDRERVTVTVLRGFDLMVFSGTFFRAGSVHDFALFDVSMLGAFTNRDGIFKASSGDVLTAWRPAPQPYREVSK